MKIKEKQIPPIFGICFSLIKTIRVNYCTEDCEAVY
jgi:hypothetical protein